MGWERLENGALLKTAADGEFEAFLSIDKKLEHEQNLARLAIPIVVLDAPSNALPDLLPLIPFLQQLLAVPLERILYIVEPNGDIHRFAQPRPQSPSIAEHGWDVSFRWVGLLESSGSLQSRQYGKLAHSGGGIDTWTRVNRVCGIDHSTAI
jgi:hypothetical protein